MSSSLFTVREAADRLNVSEKTIRNLLKSGKLDYHRIGAGRGVIRISEEALNRHLDDCEVKGDETFRPRIRRERLSLRHIRLKP